ncbi:hypothetical protein BN85408400 [Alteracholeplasma palmae J233]|uniref:HTH cro/C1-type domain-containing protein n=2 Tax=Acholeplasma palmae TaxID=38986 RepID=U4KL14_ALTPJ|nr:hypothetical protein BN85408400 [Alteracholeplasma palmae J233]
MALTIAKNITFYRKQLNLTQFELAEKLNYSDKSISKWERADGIPDVATLVDLSKLFGVTLDQLVFKEPRKNATKKRSRTLLSYFYASIIFAVATLIFGLFTWFNVEYENWLLFIWAVVGSSLNLLIFNIVWKRKKEIIFYQIILLWTSALLLFLHLNFNGSYFIFIFAAAVQICMFMLFYIIYKPRHQKN